MGTKGLVWSAASMGVLLNEGIGDTIRVSLTPKPGGDRREEVYAACELLQALGLRTFAPSVTACPGCGRTTSSTFQELAERTQEYIRERMPQWKVAVRRRRGDDPRRDGVRRERPGRVEGREHRHQPARDRRVTELPGVHRRPALHDLARHLRGARPSPSADSWTTMSPRGIRGGPTNRRSVDPAHQRGALLYSLRRCSPSTSSNAGVPLASEPRPSARSDISVGAISRPPTRSGVASL